MDRNQQAGIAQHRAIKVYTKRPDLAHARTIGMAEVGDGLGCRYAEGDQTQQIDMPVAIGGGGTAPSPGFFGRAAISGCIAIGIKMMATREGVALDHLRVRISQNWDNRGVLAMQGADTVAQQTRVSIEILSPEDDRVLDDLVTRALQVDPWFLTFRDRQAVQVSVQVMEGAGQ